MCNSAACHDGAGPVNLASLFSRSVIQTAASNRVHAMHMPPSRDVDNLQWRHNTIHHNVGVNDGRTELASGIDDLHTVNDRSCEVGRHVA